MSIEHDEFLALKALEGFPKKRLEELRKRIIDEAVRTGNMSVAVSYGGGEPVGYVKVERSVSSGAGSTYVTDQDAFVAWMGEHTRTVTDVNFDALAQLREDEFGELADFVALHWPWCVEEVELKPSVADMGHDGSTVFLTETGETVPGLAYEEAERVVSYKVVAVEANRSGNAGTKLPSLERVSQAIGGGFKQLTDGSMFALEGEVVE